MCDENNIEILNINLADDQLNWSNNTLNPIETVDSKLRLKPSGKTSLFSRTLGQLSADREKLRIKLNLDIFRPIQSGSRDINYFFQLFIGGTMVAQFTLADNSLQPGETAKYFLDRVIDLPTLAGNIILKIATPIGYENTINLSNIVVNQFHFCTENVRTYFAIDGLFDESLFSMSTAILFNSFKVDGAETLTIDFRDYNTKKLGNKPLDDWYFADAELDGTNRVAETQFCNSFNPFIKELGLVYDPGNYYSGLPVDTISGKNFGAAIMKLGIDKPAVLNADGILRNGAFFIDLDYTKSFYISFDVAINNLSSNAFLNPESYRKYVIAWDFDKKEKSFFYTDYKTGTTSNQLKNGFLTGLTGFDKLTNEIPVGLGVNFGSNEIPYSLIVNLESGEKITGINYEIKSEPAKIDIAFGDQRFSTGYVGNSQYNQKLLNIGVPASEIKTVDSDNYASQLKFTKTVDDPDFFKVTITAPIDGTKATFIEESTPYIKLYLGVGGCGDEITFDKVGFLAVSDLRSFDVTDGMEIKNDGTLAAAFNGGDDIFKAYIYDKTGRRDIRKTFKISATGVVSETTICNL